MRRNCLYTSCPFLSDLRSPISIHKSSEFEQIRYTEQRTLLAEDDLRVGGSQIRPLQRNGANRDLVDPEQETVFRNGCIARPRKSSSLPLSGWNGCVMRTRRTAATE